ncbi:MAG: TlpA disulfide reductase family protein [Myxococcota bacterium]
MTPARQRVLLLVVAVLVAGAAGALVGIRGSATPPLRQGAIAPDFSLPALDGRERSLSELRGRVVFVNFWATWCAPCEEEAPALDRLYRRLRDEDFEILAVSIDAPGQRSRVNEFGQEYSLSFPILLDPEQRAYAAYKASGVPETFLVGPDGRLVERFIGPRDWDQPRYASAVRRLLDG